MKEAMKLALGALENIVDAIYVNSQQEADAVYKANNAIKALEKALANHCEDNLYMVKQQQGEPFFKFRECEDSQANQLKHLPAAQQKIGCVNHDCEQCKAQQALDRKAENARELGLNYEQEQGEPVSIVCSKGPKFHHVAILTDSGKQLEDGTKLYTTPQQRTWVGLTDENWDEVLEDFPHIPDINDFKKIEAKLKEKNT